MVRCFICKKKHTTINCLEKNIRTVLLKNENVKKNMT